LIKEHPEDHILENIALTDNVHNIFPVVYEIIDGNQELTEDLISILIQSNETKIYAI